MPVTVRTNQPASSGRSKITHEKADNFQVADGHLKLFDSSPGRGHERHVAVYAPGQWTDAVVDGAAGS